MILVLALALITLLWLLAWLLERRARAADPVWETLNALHSVDRVVVYDPKGRRKATGYRTGNTITVKMG